MGDKFTVVIGMVVTVVPVLIAGVNGSSDGQTSFGAFIAAGAGAGDAGLGGGTGGGGGSGGGEAQVQS